MKTKTLQILSGTIEIREFGDMDEQQIENLCAIIDNRTLVYYQGHDGKYEIYQSQLLYHNMLIALAEYFKDKTFYQSDLKTAAEILVLYHDQLKSAK